MDATQANRNVRLETPLGPDVLLLGHMTAVEQLSQPFEFTLDLFSESGTLDPDAILGKEVCVVIDLDSADNQRRLHGFVTRFVHSGFGERYNEYQATVRPWYWMLTRTADCRIFQNKSVPDIFEAVVREHKFSAYKLKLRGSYPKWEYCVQYRESDFNFLNRLLEQEGICYFFEHDERGHTMVLADAPSAHGAVPGYEAVPYYPPDMMSDQRERDHLISWSVSKSVQPGAYATRDFDFEKPKSLPSATATVSREHAHSSYEVFDYPAELADLVTGEADRLAKVRIEELGATQALAQGRGNAAGLATGTRFKLVQFPREDYNIEYLVIGTSLSVSTNAYETGSGAAAQIMLALDAIDAKTPFRPARVTPKPVIQGTQTAVVVGKSGEEIYTDEFGRVKVQFHWDREGQFDENSSCWVRVAQVWAGTTWGGIHVPRIGQEVIVSFLEGDPDQPIITGRVYNGDNKVPYGLPANATQSGIKSRSSKGGGEANFNEIRFEDKKGSEQVYIHAEKNQDIVVENDETHSVGHDRKKDIGNDETTSVGHNRTETVGSNETITIGSNRAEKVGVNETIQIGQNRSITVGGSETATVALQRTHSVGVNETISVGAAQQITVGAAQAITVGANQAVNVGANQSVDVGADATMSIGKNESRSVGQARSTEIGKDDALKVGKNLIIDAGDSVTIKTGSASITMKKDGTITIKGKDISVNGSGKINIKASSDVVIKGSKIKAN